MYCTNCGTQLPDNVKFCSSCGTPTNQTISPLAQHSLPPDQPNITQIETETAHNAVSAVESFFLQNRWAISKDKKAIDRIESDLQLFLRDGLKGLLDEVAVINQSQKTQILRLPEIQKSLELTLLKRMLLYLAMNRRPISKDSAYVLADHIGIEEFTEVADYVSLTMSVIKK